MTEAEFNQKVKNYIQLKKSEGVPEGLINKFVAERRKEFLEQQQFEQTGQQIGTAVDLGDEGTVLTDKYGNVINTIGGFDPDIEAMENEFSGEKVSTTSGDIVDESLVDRLYQVQPQEEEKEEKSATTKIPSKSRLWQYYGVPKMLFETGKRYFKETPLKAEIAQRKLYSSLGRLLFGEKNFPKNWESKYGVK